jgi:hypothetical protein
VTRLIEFRVAEESQIDARLDEGRAHMKSLVQETRKLIPQKTMANGYANETPETKPLNDAISGLWGVLDRYGDSQYDALEWQIKVMRLTEQLDREKEKTHEERERADEAEALVKELERDHGNREAFVRRFWDMLIESDREFYTEESDWFARVTREMKLHD